ncbi:hypothetical protein PCH_Pc22g17920 [Penicillium rubens Wisconsin 54-1255]|uniref:Uncharacterized protein n=1 Tax=Penicillium rubens (strain ATCC 28089 / DSM 1075 / NRRL 1951 / Wisconsin 54-1255) TaxID=500485 RepID=B6HTP5_PENRW|nr:hypothetical protein PCH_Pc22g17920 [Penicillium rubens Wisconsin 54-1255]
MCHSIIWYHALCQHQCPDASYSIACHGAFRRGYECTEDRSTLYFSLVGNCVQCKINQLLLRHRVFREWRREDLVSALNHAFQYSDEDGWAIDDNDAEELDMETWVSQFPNLTQRCFAQRAENRETHDEDEEPQPQTGRSWRSMIPLPTRLVRNPQNRTYLAFITDDDMPDREPLLRASKSRKCRRTWRSWIPLPVKKVSGQ